MMPFLKAKKKEAGVPEETAARQEAFMGA